MGLGPEARDRTRKGGAGPELALGWMSPIAADREVVGLGRGLELAVPSPRGGGRDSAFTAVSAAINRSRTQRLPANAFDLEILSFKKSPDGLFSRLWTLPNGLTRPLLLPLSFCPPHKAQLTVYFL